MIGQYEVYLSTDTGSRLAMVTDWLGLEYSRVVHGVGVCNLDVSLRTFDRGLVHEDYKIEVWRQPPGGALALEDIYLIRAWEQWGDDSGHYLRLTGVNGNHILKRTVADSQPSSSWTRITDHADDMCKLIVSRYVGRRVLNNQFRVAADQHLGAEFTKRGFSWRNLHELCTAIADTSTGRGVPIYWLVVPLSPAQYEFRTYLNQVGQDRRTTIEVSEARNNLRNPRYTWNSMDEVNYGIILGTVRSGEDRYAQYLNDIPRQEVSQYGFCFPAVLSTALSDYSELADEGRQWLVKNRPRETFTCELYDNEAQRYGREWGFGDQVRVVYDVPQKAANIWDARVKTVHVSVRETEIVRAILDIPMTSTITEG